MRIETDESHDLISAEKVDGTAIYGADGDKMGHVKTVMINKRSGQVAHVVADIGSFLGMGGEYHALPWDKFTYDTDLNGYNLDVTEEQLRGGPTFREDNSNQAFDRDYETRMYGYYGSTPYFA
ncbi:PRC-barrel domain-containing protein [Pacificimonas sp. ICDLI1SI03]